MSKSAPSIRDLLRLTPGAEVRLDGIDPRDTPGGPADKEAAEADFARTAPEFASLQERLMGESTDGGTRSVLMVLQGMDTSGKGGTIKYLDAALYPLGLLITSFKKPTEEEARHHFLWRIRHQLPEPGQIGIFDRSHYEDVLVARVHDLVPPATWERRYEEIEAFESELAETGTVIIKCLLHISSERQRERLLARLDEPQKHWKFSPADIEERAYWDDYQEAYRVALRRTGTQAAPWYVVPADRKWYRNWAVAQILLETLRELDPRYPVMPAQEVADYRARLEAEG